MIRTRFEGGAELAASFNSLSTRMSRKIIMEGLTDGAEPIRRHASAVAPREPGAPDIADNIVISAAQRIGSERRQAGEHAVAVGPAKGFSYGLLLEYGFMHTGGRFVPAQPFMRPAFDGQYLRSLKIIADSWWTALAGKGINRPTIEAPSVVQSMGRGL